MLKMKKTKERPQGAMVLHSSSSSSISRESPPEICHYTSVGCMSGIFRLFSKHHSNRQKFITVGGNKEEQSGSVEVVVNRKIISTDSSSTIAAAEKRMMLLGALAKCDEDLRELKKIIEELQSDSLVVDRNDGMEAERSSGEQPSPVSVLDEVTRSPPFYRCKRGRTLQYVNATGNVQQQQQIKKIHDEDFLGTLHLISIQKAVKHGNNLSGSPLWCSRAMVETVEKACSEMVWGEKREIGRIGMALQDQIYRDLINEMIREVMEIGKMNYTLHLRLSYMNGKLHGRGCRRRLSY